jgi:hypothetical protein
VSTQKLLSIACFWPGLPQLWVRGSWVGLLVAVGFTALLNVWLLATVVFVEWFTLQERIAGFAILTTVWLVAWRISVSQHRAVEAAASELLSAEQTETDHPAVAPSRGVSEQLYQAALHSYLQGDWVATERNLLGVLKENPRDVEARLMLATLWRRQGRGAEALRQLDRLERLEASEKWTNEIACERTEIARISNSSTEEMQVIPLEQEPTAEQESNNDDTDQRRLAA